ncbi:MAG: hypothetical protein A4E53_02580 [Pelotomaculum sp. PtaB.Bin104]|nr:MAG: hypothetical protein A4E53_02580 [Pelotomaculum sp. PtaB.Bin104]
MVGLKKLNTNIKKHIDAITNEKSAGEIVQDFFVYHKDIGSKAYHRIKTSDNISHFRSSIIEKLYGIVNDENIFKRAVQGYMEIEQVTDQTGPAQQYAPVGAEGAHPQRAISGGKEMFKTAAI